MSGDNNPTNPNKLPDWRDQQLGEAKPIHSTLPPTFKKGRELTLQLAKVERDLFTEIEEQQSGNYIIRGLELSVSPVDLEAFCMAIGQELYNQSYLYGNTEQNSGISRRIAEKLQIGTGISYHMGEVIVTLNDICRKGYGVENPDKSQKKAMEALIKTLDKHEAHITFSDGNTLDAKLCVTLNKYTDHKNGGAITYHLILNPIFCNKVATSYALYPQDVTLRLSKAIAKRKGKKTAAVYKLLNLLAIQDNRKPFVRHTAQLLTELALMEAYKMTPARIEKQLVSAFDVMCDIGIALKYEIEYYKSKRGRKAISKVTFTLNPNFAKPISQSEVQPPLLPQ